MYVLELVLQVSSTHDQYSTWYSILCFSLSAALSNRAQAKLSVRVSRIKQKHHLRSVAWHQQSLRKFSRIMTTGTTTNKCYHDDDCLNGGRCRMSNNANDFLQPLPSGKSGSCNCPPSFTGPFCEQHHPGSSRDSPQGAGSSKDHAACTVDDECFNGGMCLVTSTGHRNEDRHDFLQPPQVATYCSCRSGYIGRFCEIRDYNSPNYPISPESIDEALLSPGSIVGIAVGGLVLMVSFIYLVVKKGTATGGNDGLVKHTGPITPRKGGVLDFSRASRLRQRKQKHQAHSSTVNGPVPIVGPTAGVDCPIA